MKKIFAVMTCALSLTGCSENMDRSPLTQHQNSISWLWNTETQVITVTTMDERPLENAKILIGNSVNEPFAGNLLQTNAQGTVVIPAAWTSSAPITVEADGYIRVTYMDQVPGSFNFKLKKKSQSQQFEVKGQAKNLPIVDKDGFVDFGLVMPAFTKADLLAFNINTVISSQTDNISVMGFKVPLPSNISLPRQSEKYSLLTITMDKPNYRIYFGNQGVQRVYAAKGKFPFKSTVEQIREGKEFYELINSFSITGGVIRDIESKSASNILDLPMNELSFTDKTQVKAPVIGSDEIFVSMGIAQQSGYMIPTDIKRQTSNSVQSLNILAGTKPYILGAVMKAQDLSNGIDRMSAALLTATGIVTPQLLPLIASPTIQGNALVLPSVSTIPDINPLGVYSVLSLEESVLQGGNRAEVLNPQWEIYASQWPQQLELPQFPSNQPLAGKKRWEVNFIGSQTASQTAFGPAMIEAATHVTHSSVSF